MSSSQYSSTPSSTLALLNHRSVVKRRGKKETKQERSPAAPSVAATSTPPLPSPPSSHPSLYELNKRMLAEIEKNRKLYRELYPNDTVSFLTLADTEDDDDDEEEESGDENNDNYQQESSLPPANRRKQFHAQKDVERACNTEVPKRKKVLTVPTTTKTAHSFVRSSENSTDEDMPSSILWLGRKSEQQQDKLIEGSKKECLSDRCYLRQDGCRRIRKSISQMYESVNSSMQNFCCLIVILSFFLMLGGYLITDSQGQLLPHISSSEKRVEEVEEEEILNVEVFTETAHLYWPFRLRYHMLKTAATASKSHQSTPKGAAAQEESDADQPSFYPILYVHGMSNNAGFQEILPLVFDLEELPRSRRREGGGSSSTRTFRVFSLDYSNQSAQFGVSILEWVGFAIQRVLEHFSRSSSLSSLGKFTLICSELGGFACLEALSDMSESLISRIDTVVLLDGNVHELTGGGERKIDKKFRKMQEKISARIPTTLQRITLLEITSHSHTKGRLQSLLVDVATAGGWKKAHFFASIDLRDVFVSTFRLLLAHRPFTRLLGKFLTMQVIDNAFNGGDPSRVRQFLTQFTIHFDDIISRDSVEFSTAAELNRDCGAIQFSGEQQTASLLERASKVRVKEHSIIREDLLCLGINITLNEDHSHYYLHTNLLSQNLKLITTTANSSIEELTPIFSFFTGTVYLLPAVARQTPLYAVFSMNNNTLLHKEYRQFHQITFNYEESFLHITPLSSFSLTNSSASDQLLRTTQYSRNQLSMEDGAMHSSEPRRSIEVFEMRSNIINSFATELTTLCLSQDSPSFLSFRSQRGIPVSAQSPFNLSKALHSDFTLVISTERASSRGRSHRLSAATSSRGAACFALELSEQSSLLVLRSSTTNNDEQLSIALDGQEYLQILRSEFLPAMCLMQVSLCIILLALQLKHVGAATAAVDAQPIPSQIRIAYKNIFTFVVVESFAVLSSLYLSETVHHAGSSPFPPPGRQTRNGILISVFCSSLEAKLITSIAITLSSLALFFVAQSATSFVIYILQSIGVFAVEHLRGQVGIWRLPLLKMWKSVYSNWVVFGFLPVIIFFNIDTTVRWLLLVTTFFAATVVTHTVNFLHSTNKLQEIQVSFTFLLLNLFYLYYIGLPTSTDIEDDSRQASTRYGRLPIISATKGESKSSQVKAIISTVEDQLTNESFVATMWMFVISNVAKTHRGGGAATLHSMQIFLIPLAALSLVFVLDATPFTYTCLTFLPYILYAFMIRNPNQDRPQPPQPFTRARTKQRPTPARQQTQATINQ